MYEVLAGQARPGVRRDPVFHVLGRVWPRRGQPPSRGYATTHRRKGETCGFKAGVQVPTVGDWRRGFASHQESTGEEECSVWETCQRREFVGPWTQLRMDDLGAERIGKSEIDGDGMGRPYSTDYGGLR